MIINRKFSFECLQFCLRLEFSLTDTNLKRGEKKQHRKGWAADLKQICENKVSYLQDCD